MIVTIIALNEKTWHIEFKEKYELVSFSQKKIVSLKKDFYSKHLLDTYDWHKIKVITNREN